MVCMDYIYVSYVSSFFCMKWPKWTDRLVYEACVDAMIGYTDGDYSYTRVVITIEIPEDARTNLNRPNIEFKETARYQTDKCKVLKIEDADGKEYESATVGLYMKRKNPITYIVGQVAEDTGFDTKRDENYPFGIHFFLQKRCAELYYVFRLEGTGLFQRWHENGQKSEEVMYVNGNEEGLRQKWHDNGQKRSEVLCISGIENGPYQSWYPNGQKSGYRTLVNGREVGTYQCWHPNGQKSEEVTSVNKVREGLYQSWYSNGQKCEEIEYTNDQKGPYRRWHENGQLSEEGYYRCNEWRQVIKKYDLV